MWFLTRRFFSPLAGIGPESTSMPKKSTARGRGRPAHAPTAATRRRVAIAAGGGMLHEQIAIALGICTDTLRKHYEPELSVGAAQRRMAVLEAQYAAATKKGSTSAAKVYLANEPQIAAPPVPAGAAAPAPGPAPAAAAPAPKLGKKEQANVDAARAAEGTEWGDLLPRAGATLQ
jgi:hypothetical protein